MLAAVVTYNGQDHIQDCLSSLDRAATWTFPVYIVDNASTDRTREEIRDRDDAPELSMYEMPENRGVAAAYNLALLQAERLGVRWVFLLDQDSRCQPGCLDTLCRHGEALGQSGDKVGAVCPVAYSRHFPHVIHMPYIWDGGYLRQIEAEEDRQVVQVDSTITSGTLYNAQALRNVGGFREEYFIDFVDHECHLRLAKAGWSMWWIRGAFVEHELGVRQTMTPEGLWIEHEPFRYYYMVRNMLHGIKQQGGYRGVLSFFNELRKHIGKMKKYSKAPNTCILYMLKGMVHAVRGRFGPLQ